MCLHPEDLVQDPPGLSVVFSGQCPDSAHGSFLTQLPPLQ